MANFYELLKIQPTASEKEIEAVIIQQYDQWRRLVTHHDGNVVNQANQALALLEQMRATLLNPTKRDVYDMAVGVKDSQVGGLADPSVLFDNLQLITLPNSKQVQPEGKPASNVSSTWTCSHCHTSNPTKTKFCSKCGTQLGITCPSCSNLTNAGDPFCAECGKNIAEETTKSKELSFIKGWINSTKSQMMKLKYAPAVRALVAKGTFSEIIKVCYDVATVYDMSHSEVTYKKHNIRTDLSTGEVYWNLRNSWTSKYTLEVVVQKSQQLSRGVLILGLSDRFYELFSDVSFIVDPYTEQLLKRSNRFQMVK